ncbi:hypothetical protein VN24_12025 [Paenibacillus beijingensis]|uniref:AbrB family transcriptional regulator n=2 Tax=Paenibacillus beijingensis TaxID=1126833 RepID=A0A0D5NRT0_9BACL|nr:hypothetical protein VN24_12025 [Paenibacillus beijingensis]
MLLHLPISWMLGPLTAVVCWKAVTGRKLHWPVGLRNSGQLLLSYSMGLSFTIESARQIAGQLPVMLGSTIMMVGLSLGVAYLIAARTGIGSMSSMMGSIPGGLSQMVPLSQEIQGAEPAIVTFMQTIRMLTVIITVPFLAIHGLAGAEQIHGVQNGPFAGDLSDKQVSGASWAVIVLLPIAGMAAARLKIPTPWILGPLLVSAVFTAAGWPMPHLPKPFIIFAQLCIGIYLGLGIKLDTIGALRRLLPYSLAGACIIVTFSLALSYLLSLVYPMSLVTAFLSTAPGGLAEMGVTAITVHADVSIVSSYQLFRLLFILLIVPYMLKWWAWRTGKNRNPQRNRDVTTNRIA